MSDYAENTVMVDQKPKEPGGSGEKPDYKELLEEARERFAHIVDVDKDNRDNAKADTKFVYSPGEQWPSEFRDQRKAWKEPCLEFNQLKQFVAQVVNDMRQARPGIRVHPASGDASKETAELIQGLVRSIEYDSKANTVYDNGGQGAVVGGRGWWRVCSEYLAGKGFEQRLIIKPIFDPSTVYADLDYQEPDGCDRNYVFVVDSCPKDEFKRRYPKAEPLDWENLDKNWAVDNKNVFIADYYRRVCETKAYYELADGRQGYKEDLGDFDASQVKRQRNVETYRCEWYTIAGGQQVLEKYDWPGTIIPVVCCVGEDIMLDGKRIYQGLVRHARDAQSMLNFGMTQQAVHLALSPRAPYKASARAIAGYEQMWRDANQKNFSTLIYNDRDEDGEIREPTREAPAMIEAGWQAWSTQMLQMVRSTIGMYENSLGMKGQETSGRAIFQREKQGDNATFNYPDNQARAIALTGRILVEVIPTFYDTQRIVHTVGIDETRKAVTINQATPAVVGGALTAIKQNDVTTGDYAVTVDSGPSYTTKRQETAQALLALVKEIPQIAQGAPDLVVKSLDIADADALAERLKLMLPPPVQQALQAKEQGQKPMDPAAQAKIQELQMHLDKAAETMKAMDEEVQKLRSGAAQKVEAAKADAEARVAIAQAQESANFHIAQLREEKGIETEHIKGAYSLERARIEAMTKRELQEMGDQTKVRLAVHEGEVKKDIASAEHETKRDIAADQQQTAKDMAAMKPAAPEKTEA